MRMSRNLLILAGASLLAAGSAVAARAARGTLHLYESLNVQGQQLPPGDYEVEWNGEGPKVELNIINGKKTVASVPAQVVTLNEKYPTDGYASKQSEDGTSSLTEIFFHGKNYELRLGNQASAETAQSGTSGSN